MFRVLEHLSGTIQASPDNYISLELWGKKMQHQNQPCGSHGQVMQVLIARAGPATTSRSGELLFPKVLLHRALSRCERTERETISWVSPSNASSWPCLCDTWYMTRSEILSVKTANVHTLTVKQLLIILQIVPVSAQQNLAGEGIAEVAKILKI